MRFAVAHARAFNRFLGAVSAINQESAINLVVPSSVFVLLKLVLLLVLAVAVVVGRALAVEQWRLGAGGEERNIISVVT